MTVSECMSKANALSEPQVTVVCVTYNQEGYIREALDSFVSQQTNFSFQIFVGDDCSTDSTPDILREYQDRYPGLVVPFIREKNLGPQGNMIDMIEAARTRYIALCDGDDYWIDNLKLQKQFDYMEENLDYRFCFARTLIPDYGKTAESSWYNMNSDGEYVVPDMVPGYKEMLEGYSAIDILKSQSMLFGQTSSYFFRWNYDVSIPEWFTLGKTGDAPLRLLQIGNEKGGSIPDVVSVYRINETSVFSGNSSSITEHFYKTRVDSYIRWMDGLSEYYSKIDPSFWEFSRDIDFDSLDEHEKRDMVARNRETYLTTLRNSMIRETFNYVRGIREFGAYEEFAQMLVGYPYAADAFFMFALSCYDDRKRLEGVFGWDRYKKVLRNRSKLQLLNSYSSRLLKRDKVKQPFKKAKKKAKSAVRLAKYQRASFKGVDKRIWVVAGFRGKSYMDNTKYLFEFLASEHPEIDAYFISKDGATVSELKAKGLKALKSGTEECQSVCRRAAVAIIDHYRTDFDLVKNLNPKTQFVNLWHGVGLKNGKPGGESIKEKGVRPSPDLVVSDSDSVFARVGKRMKRALVSHKRELFEEYLLFLSPGEDTDRLIADAWGIPKSAIFRCGYPRTDHMFRDMINCGADGRDEEFPFDKRILFAPTYRYDALQESKFIDSIIGYLPRIQKTMELLNAEFVLRLHPHTWRDYKARLNRAIKNLGNISIDGEKDLYDHIADFDMMISDYSSTIFDFALLKRPTIFYMPDMDSYNEIDEYGIIPDYMEHLVGPVAYDLDELFDLITKCLKSWDDYAELQAERLPYFHSPETTDESNSERIVDEIKRRIGWEDR